MAIDFDAIPGYTALKAQFNRTEANIDSLQNQAELAKQANNIPAQLAYQAQLQQQRDRLTQLDNQIAQLEFGAAAAEESARNSIQAQPTASAGQVVAEAARARDDGAAASNPSTPTGTVQVVSADQVNQNLEVGTDGRVRPQTQTQATPPSNNGTALPFITGDDDGNPVPGIPTTQTGAAANRDDNTAPNNNATAQIINSSFNQRIVPDPNVLDEYASYTYAITWYLLTPDQYNEMVRSQKKNCASWQLLMQSGGAPTQAAGVTANSTATAGRNPRFSQDYYIDDLEIDSMSPLKGTGAANTATDIRFKVTEPNGITLIENLYKAVSDLYKEKNVSKQANYPMAQYCLAVRFYGYNESGELVTTGRRGTGGKTNLTDPKAIVEKFYPFVITNIKFRIPKDRVVEYEVQAKPIPHFYNKSQDRGTIPFAFELTGETVGQVLRGKPVGTVYPASSGERRTTSQPTPSAPSQPAASVNNISASAGVDANGNFTGETASPFAVVGA
jgi:hypothetical protein